MELWCAETYSGWVIVSGLKLFRINLCPSAYRCVKPDQSSTTVRMHYLKDGNVNFALTINRAEYFIPVGVLLKTVAEVC